MGHSKTTGHNRRLHSTNIALMLIESAMAIVILTMLASILLPKLIALSGAG